jgi:hypothetical protein
MLSFGSLVIIPTHHLATGFLDIFFVCGTISLHLKIQLLQKCGALKPKLFPETGQVSLVSIKQLFSDKNTNALKIV